MDNQQTAKRKWPFCRHLWPKSASSADCGKRDRTDNSTAFVRQISRGLKISATHEIFRNSRKLGQFLKNINAWISSQDFRKTLLAWSASLDTKNPKHTASRAIACMAAGHWGEAHSLWRKPFSASITGEQQQLWNAGRIITQWILDPETLVEATSQKYLAADTSPEETVVSSAITSNHDLSWPAGELLHSTHYIRFTDDPSISTWNIWQNRPLEYLADSPVRSARWVKTHPHMLFPDSRWVIWLDGNIIPVQGLQSLLAEFQASGHPMAAIPHPSRTRVDEEIAACIRRGKDDPETIKQHHTMLGEDPLVGLWETGVCFFDLDHPQLKPLLTTWWSHIESGSHRDQISLPYAVKATDSTIHPLLPPGHSTRSDQRFALIPHGEAAFRKAHTQLKTATQLASLKSPTEFAIVGRTK